MGQMQTDIWTESKLFYKSTYEVMKNVMSETPKRSELTDWVVPTVELSVGLEMKDTQESLT